MLPFGDTIALAGLILVGLGCAPIFPCLLHETPKNFGEENSQAIMGIQMASAYLGNTFMAPFFGFLAENISISLYPAYLIAFIVLMALMSERVNTLNSKSISKESEVNNIT